MEPLKLGAELRAVKSRRDIQDNIEQTIVLKVWGTPAQIGILNALYSQSIEISIEVKQ